MPKIKGSDDRSSSGKVVLNQQVFLSLLLRNKKTGRSAQRQVGGCEKLKRWGSFLANSGIGHWSFWIWAANQPAAVMDGGGACAHHADSNKPNKFNFRSQRNFLNKTWDTPAVSWCCCQVEGLLAANEAALLAINVYVVSPAWAQTEGNGAIITCLSVKVAVAIWLFWVARKCKDEANETSFKELLPPLSPPPPLSSLTVCFSMADPYPLLSKIDTQKS